MLMINDLETRCETKIANYLNNYSFLQCAHTYVCIKVEKNTIEIKLHCIATT